MGPMPELPSGTVTLLFTDIQGSTRLLDEFGDRYADVLAEHRRVVRAALARHDGVEVDTQGDAFFLAFERARDAVATAGEVQAELAGGPVLVRVGIHTGEPIVTDEGYVGADVHRAARIMSAGHGGQVVISETTRQLLDSSVELRDLGEHRLKDLSAAQRLHQLGGHDFPPLRTLYRTNLPTQSTPLVGRVRELEEAGTLLRSRRLLTLTGPGGSGKTRLALQLAADAVDEFPDGVFWVPLQALRDPALVERAIAASLGADTGLVEHVGNKRLLVLLDNFEQVVDAASVVSTLLSQTPSAQVLATSREPLHVESEQRYPVEPLPDGDAETLLVERARAVEPGFRSTAVVGEICRRLDRLPLAIELAAARVTVLTPEELLARLDHRLPLLSSRSRDAPARQRTLHATIEWSYELLEPSEQELFRRVSVFDGSFSLESAEAVCGADLDALESLVAKSLLRRWDSGRLGMLETIREYALERLDESPEAESTRLRHAEFFLAIGERANLSAGSLRPGGQHVEIAIAEQHNIRAALAWTLSSDSIALGLAIATSVEQFWTLDDPREGMRWFEALLARADTASVPPDLRAHALRAYGSSADIAGSDDVAIRAYEQSLALFDELGDHHGRAVLLHRLGIQAMRRGDLEHARALVDESHAIHEATSDLWGQAQTVGALGAIARDAGDAELAFELIGRSAELARESGVPWWENGMVAELAALSLGANRVDAAEMYAREMLEVADRMRDRSGLVFGVGLLACVAAERGDLAHAGRLWGAIETEDAGAPLGGWRRHRGPCEARLRRAADPDFERGCEEGRSLTLDDGVALAVRPASG